MAAPLELPARRIVVEHASFGCDSGCCGHVIEIDGRDDKFVFGHPWGETDLEFAQRIVRERFGAEHVTDLDWANCIIVSDC